MRRLVAGELGVPIVLVGFTRPNHLIVRREFGQQLDIVERSAQPPFGSLQAFAFDVVHVGKNTHMRTLTAAEWRPLADAHAGQIDAWSEGRRSRQGERHPIDDFLWEYYSFRPAHLRRWHPGVGVALEDAPEHAQWPHYVTRDGATFADAASIAERRRTFTWVRDLLQQTLDREARFVCFGMHEWAMVYGLEQHEVRHEQAPLRLSPVQIRATVDALPPRCTHYDAFRFYTPEAVPLNEFTLTRETQSDCEQSGCLHANMDLYKWCYKLTPFVPSDLTRDAFALAREARLLDVEASPYDLRAWGVAPLHVDTAEGRAEFVRRQRAISERANVLRQRLLSAIDGALAPR